MVACPICDKQVNELHINLHIDSSCADFIESTTSPPPGGQPPSATQGAAARKPSSKTASRFFTPASRKSVSFGDEHGGPESSPLVGFSSTQAPREKPVFASTSAQPVVAKELKRAREEDVSPVMPVVREGVESKATASAAKRAKNSNAPLAERMRPHTLDDVAGQSLVGPDGVLRNLILTDRVPSMILWGGPGTGKTTIARLIAQTAGTRFVEINSTSSGVGDVKKLFAEAKNELGLTGRKTIIFCDEIHRFSKSQQDVFLGPVEAGAVTLIGATTENPSFKVVNALLSRCRTFTLAKLTEEHIFTLLKRALAREVPGLPTPSPSPSAENASPSDPQTSISHLLAEDEYALLHYLSAFADGDARTGLNLLELALDLCERPGTTADDIKKSLTQTLVYDRAGDQHYDTISAFHKSVRGSDPDATLYYLSRMLTSGEDPLYIARRMIVIASEDVGLADNTLLSLATAAYSAAEKVGMPECRINLAHCAVALALAPKSVRAYRGLKAAETALREPGVAGLPVPIHLRNAPTKLMKELGYGKEYKYPPDYVEGRVVQEYLPEKLTDRIFLGEEALGSNVDPEVAGNAAAGLEGEARGEEEVLLNPDGD